jgi:hypothetical protein
MEIRIYEIAAKFMLRGIQEWGQSDTERAETTAAYLKAAGFNVEPSGYPVFGGMFPQQAIKGPDGEAAYSWLDETLSSMQRGEFNNEVMQLAEAATASIQAKR